MPTFRNTPIYAGLAALTMVGACASAPSPAQPTAQATGSEEYLPKPTPEEIARVQRTDALTQVNFWNEYYNIHPTDLDVSLAFIRALRAIKSYERAAEVATFTSVTFPDNVDVLIELGRAELANNKPSEAVEAYARASDLAPYDAAPIAAIGSIYDMNDTHETAQELYRKALELEPDRPATLANLGLSLALTGNLEEAESTLARAANLPLASAQIRQNYALILGLAGKFDEARTIAAIDAPDDIAARNTDFLRQMIGDNRQLQSLLEPGEKSARTQLAAAEIPASAPTQTVSSAPLPDTGSAPTQIAELSGAGQQPGTPKLKLRTRNRTSEAGGN